MNGDSVLEIHHKREESREYEDWSREDRRETITREFVTVVAVDSSPQKPFVTVLSVDPEDDSEDVLVYRLPGERLGFGLKFEGGNKTTEKVTRLLIQSCACDSPASRTVASWGPLAPGDEILAVDGSPVSEMTRIDCVRALKESNVVIELKVRHGEKKGAPPVPPRKSARKRGSVEAGEDSPPIPSRRDLPQAEVYTDLLAQEGLLPTESESDDTGSSISTVVGRLSTTSDSSFSNSDSRSTNSVDLATLPSKPPTYDIDRVLEPFLRLEREFSSEDIDESSMFTKLVEASSLMEERPGEVPELPPKPIPRQEPREKSRYGKKRPPPPPPRSYQQEEHLPRLIDFVPKDRTDIVTSSPLLKDPQTYLTVTRDAGENERRGSTQGDLDVAGLPYKPKIEMDNSTEPRIGSGDPEKVGIVEGLPPSFSRQPPDGHEFPTHYEELAWGTRAEVSLPCEEHNTFFPLTSNNIKTAKTSEEDFKKLSSKHRSWRNDEKSERSVKDKIAMFSSASNQSPRPPVARKLNRHKSSDDINCRNESSVLKDSPSKLSSNTTMIMKGSLPYGSMVDVNTGADDRKYDSIRSEKTQSTLDLTYCALEESSALPNQGHTESSTLPRKYELGRKMQSSDGKPTLSRTVSFTGPAKIHSRSQSLIDVRLKPNNTLSRTSIDDARRTSLNALIEQRRKSMSKLRGLVIPEKVQEATSQYIIDLPEIKSKECILPNLHASEEKTSVRNFDKSGNAPSDNSNACLMTVPPWKTEARIYDLPKYSPAFKRKSLSVFGVSSLGSSVSSSLSSSREELRSCFSDLPKLENPPTSALPTNFNPITKVSPVQNHTESTPVEISSPSISDAGYECLSSNFKNMDDSFKNSKYRETLIQTSKLNPDLRMAEEESDNDSALSSCRSSISHGFSPPNSPMPEPQNCEKGNIMLSRSNSSSSGGRTLKRTLSSETTASTSSNGSTLTSGSQASCSSICSSFSVDSRRVLKPQSVEAINRKNVLSSARFSSGQDLKVGSPPMHVRQEDQMYKSQDKSVVLVKLNHSNLEEDMNNEFKEISIKSSSGNAEITKPQTTEILEPTQVDSSLKIESPTPTVEEENYIDYEKCKEMSGNIHNISVNTMTQSSESANTLNLTPPPVPQKDTNSVKISKNETPTKTLNVNSVTSQTDIPVPMKNTNPHKSVSVTDIKKAFEKAEMILAPSGRLRNTGTNGCMPTHHPRVSSVDSTNSEDSFARTPTHHGSASDLQKEQQFGSITSLASSTSLISQQELSQLIEESQASEDGGCSHEVVVVVLHRDTAGGSIGITLAGGADCEAKEITVHKVLTGSPAERDGRVQKGDRILSINGKSMKSLTHRESLAILKAPRSEVVLVVSRYRVDQHDEIITTNQRHLKVIEAKTTSPSTLLLEKGCESHWGPTITVTLTKDGAGLGFSLEGGKDSPFGDQPLTIKKIFTGGCAEKCGQLYAGDELLSVNSTDLSGLSRIEAWALMKRLPDGNVHLNIRHPLS